MTQAPSTSEWVRRAANDRPAAFEALYCRLAPGLFVWSSMRIPVALRHLLDPEDVLQEVWCRALRAASTFDAQRGTFRSWLYGIASRTVAEGLRRITVRGRGLARQVEPDQLIASVTSVTQQVVRRDDLARLLAEVEQLPEIDRRLVMFRGLEGLPHAEVGERLGLTEGAAEVRWRRLRERLRQTADTDGLFARD